ncbi:39S ribosomal protein L44, mitochondrial [Saitoella coloradoensis]
MITKYIRQVHAVIQPFSPTSKSVRIFVSQIKPTLDNPIKLTTKVLPSTSTDKPTLAVTYSDGKKVEFETHDKPIGDLIVLVDRHSRAIKAAEL